jgi:opacity protein-like surface antigen
MKRFVVLAALLSVLATPSMAQITVPQTPGASGASGAPGGTTLPPGLYVQVIDGVINVSNKGGTTSFSAGQFGYTANVATPPVMVPKNPGMTFTPPPAFNSSTPGTNTSSAPAKSNSVDCEVR